MDIATESHSLGNVSDEKLVHLFRHHQNLAARNVLLLRYLDEVGKLVVGQGREYGLLAQELEDARQAAVFWMVEAISKYNAERDEAHNCRFRSFLHIVVNRRLIDLARRRTSREDFCGDLPVDPEDDSVNSPVRQAQRDEEQTLLEHAIDQLDPESRALCKEFLAGRSMRAAGTRLGQSYDRVKRLRRRMLEKLRRQLK